MILICGIPSEPPLAMVAGQLRRLGVPYAEFNQRRFAQAGMSFGVEGGKLAGGITLDGRTYHLDEISGVYARIMENELLPELEHHPPDSPARAYADRLLDTFLHWAEIAEGRIVNRLAPMGSNGSKPYQAQLISRHGFRTPETLITNEPDEVHGFREQHGRVVYKSISGARSIVQDLDETSLARLELIRACPVQFQAYVPGTNVRVHTIGGLVFATRIETAATDYRYAHRHDGAAPRLEATELPDEWAQRCLDLAAALGLEFAGVDLKVTGDGEVYCFEVNPSPAYSYYETNTGQPIAAAVAAHLAGRAG